MQCRSGLVWTEQSVTTSDGTPGTAQGYAFVSGDAVLADDDLLLARQHTVVVAVVGVPGREADYQRACFTPGQFVKLIRQADNRADPFGVEVWDTTASSCSASSAARRPQRSLSGSAGGQPTPS